ncbi:hypothetical protein [Streptomyces microflavus]|uniref:hypothetical protein n=1 Tax=Streptomyces microflavus TaxID=1919 RepID=UPI0033D7DB04
MRFRTVAASAALVLCAAAGATACSSSPDGSESTRPAGPASSTEAVPLEGMAGKIETGKRQAGPPQMDGQSARDSSVCAASAEEIPAECALDLSFAESSVGEPAAEAPDEQ